MSPWVGLLQMVEVEALYLEVSHKIKHTNLGVLAQQTRPQLFFSYILLSKPKLQSVASRDGAV